MESVRRLGGCRNSAQLLEMGSPCASVAGAPHAALGHDATTACSV